MWRQGLGESSRGCGTSICACISQPFRGSRTRPGTVSLSSNNAENHPVDKTDRCGAVWVGLRAQSWLLPVPQTPAGRELQAGSLEITAGERPLWGPVEGVTLTLAYLGPLPCWVALQGSQGESTRWPARVAISELLLPGARPPELFLISHEHGLVTSPQAPQRLHLQKGDAVPGSCHANSMREIKMYS